ncbi:MAG: hypothetical protein D6706_11550 [Chloroflexi bacterium]|nr:MAG: hypothetical protein D6706_11550 [Chloroflexota bacterium]
MNGTDPEILKEEGMQLFEQGAYDAALAKFETAVTAYVTANNNIGQAEMLNNIGVIHRLRRQYEEAIHALNEAQQIFRQLGDLNRQAQVLGNLGDLYAATRRPEEAAHYYQQAAELFAQTNDPLRQSQVLRACSLLRLRQARWLEAIALMEQSLAVHPQKSILQRIFHLLLRFVMHVPS